MSESKQRLLRATGDPNRVIKIESDPVTGADLWVILRRASRITEDKALHRLR
ncbi:hypothetical protein LQG66_17775 [Bradyrhizobium ontarionense]|uniref:Uncharacterized protein n=1 Tax=Bradyrhizobium ontarionense TaxID=2898149 RepID=A0ABY3RL81_9BRAD|nr:hypothetical protein [Bradyrhizobium sp. A19]UFZ08029.1 hypothetical protein LQG66_17775 [Bradyrhizobium sp. A19]